jgi:8-oxo-dGTP pyrophosphatase MutT (NUDIX family)
MQKFFDILVTDDFPISNDHPHQRIRTKIVSNSMRRTEESEAFIERRWQDHIKAGNKPWPNDLNITRYRFVGVDIWDDDIIVKVDPCVSYRDFIGAESFEFRDRFGEDFLPRSLALTALVFARTESGEERMLITLRKPGHDYKAGGYHASIGGMMDSRKETDVVQAVLRELREESGIGENDLEELTGRAVVMNRWTMHPDVIFKAVARCSVEEILRRANDGENDRLFVPTTRRSIEEWMIEPIHANVIISTAAMLLIGRDVIRRDHGEMEAGVWVDRIMGILDWCSRDYDDPAERLRLERRDIARLALMVAEQRFRDRS